MIPIKYKTSDRWGYDADHVDHELKALGATLNRIIPHAYTQFRRNINDHLIAIDADPSPSLATTPNPSPASSTPSTT